ncbi:MAG: sulfatase [Phycisphaeraceae bacterium]|nr:sulfatase [Phycisphaeraceae bacterium]
MLNDKPNVLFIFADDLRPELGCYGCKHIISPNIDRLASMGCHFEKSYVQIAVCNPSRASMLTGKRPDELSVWGLDKHFRESNPDAVTIPQHFMAHGYHTSAIGKIYHNDKPDPASWSEPRLVVPGFPYDPDCVYVDNHNLEWLEQRKDELRGTEAELKRVDEFGYWYLKAGATEMPGVPDDAYYDGAQTDLAITKLTELSAKDKPFFFGLGYYRPHLPFNVPKKYWDLYDREAIELAEYDMPPLGAPPVAMNTMKELRGYNDFSDCPSPGEGRLHPDHAKLLRHGYFASVSYIDAQVGKVLDHLERLNELDNTIIALWGDNGWKLGDYGSWGKMTNYEMDTRVPLIIKPAESLTGNSQRDQIVESVDIYPTLCGLAGLPKHEGLAGESFADHFEDPANKGKDYAFSQFLRYGIWKPEDAKEAMGYTVRSENWRYVEWFHSDSDVCIDKELYDITSQGLEQKNLAGETQYAEIEAQLALALRDYRGQTLPMRPSEVR